MIRGSAIIHLFEYFAGKTMFNDNSPFETNISENSIKFNWHLVQLEQHRLQLLEQLSSITLDL